MAASHAIHLELLGGFQVLLDGRALARQPSARQQQVVAYLLLHAHDAPVQRQRVAAALWPDSTDAQALTNLRRELHLLREAVPKLDAPQASATSGGGILGMLTPLLDRNRDGSVVDDVLSHAGKLFGSR